jgi:hypothetical protein
MILALAFGACLGGNVGEEIKLVSWEIILPMHATYDKLDICDEVFNSS